MKAILITICLMLSACGAVETPLIASAIVGEATNDLGKGLGEAISKGIGCAFATTKESITLPDTEVDFYNEILDITQQKRLNAGNFFAHIGSENAEKLNQLITNEYNSKTRKYTLRNFQDLTARGFTHIANTKDSENKFWTIRSSYRTRHYDEASKQHYNYTEFYAVKIPLILKKDATKDEDYKMESFCN